MRSPGRLYAQRHHAGGYDSGSRMDALAYLSDEIEPGERLDPRDDPGGHQASQQHASRTTLGRPHARRQQHDHEQSERQERQQLQRISAIGDGECDPAHQIP